jgi:hypothetical protein
VALAAIWNAGFETYVHNRLTESEADYARRAANLYFEEAMNR